MTTEDVPQGSLPAPSIMTIPARVCLRSTVAGVLRTDPADAHVAWLETATGQRIEVLWPTGYQAAWNTSFDRPVLEVYDATGRLFMGTSDIPAARHVCDAGRPGAVVLMQAGP